MYLNSKEQCLNILDDRNGVSEKYCEADELGHKYFYIYQKSSSCCGILFVARI